MLVALSLFLPSPHPHGRASRSFPPPALPAQGNREAESSPKTPKVSDSHRPQSKPQPAPDPNFLPVPYRRDFPFHGPLRGWAGNHSSGTAIPCCGARSGPRGRGRICLVSGFVRQCQHGGNQSDLLPSSTAACFPTAAGTACKTPASAPWEERGYG